jgi:hypothetical protein
MMNYMQKVTKAFLLVFCSCCVIQILIGRDLRSSCRMLWKLTSERLRVTHWYQAQQVWLVITASVTLSTFFGVWTDHEVPAEYSQTLPIFWNVSIHFKIILAEGILLCLSTWNSCINLIWICTTTLHLLNVVIANTYCATSQFSMLTHNYTTGSNHMDWRTVSNKPMPCTSFS